MTEKTESTALIPVQLQVNVTPAKIETNIEPLRLALIEKIDNQSKTVITLENLQEGKELAATINKTKSLLESERKRITKEACVDVDKFIEAAKGLEKICDAGYRTVKDQTDKFDLAKKSEHLQIIKGALAATWEAAGIEPEFRRATVDDLATLTAVTPKGSLTKATKTALDSRVAEDKSLQDRTNMRLVLLENQSLKAGLVAPLDRNHVAAFLFAPDDAYQKRLDAIIQSEIQRQQAAQDKARNDQLAEQARAVEQANRQTVHQVEAGNGAMQEFAQKLEPATAAIAQVAQQSQALGAQLHVNHPAFGAESEAQDKFAAVVNGQQVTSPVFTTRSDFEFKVSHMSADSADYFEIWCKTGGLVSIVKAGQVFQKVAQ